MSSMVRSRRLKNECCKLQLKIYMVEIMFSSIGCPVWLSVVVELSLQPAGIVSLLFIQFELILLFNTIGSSLA